MKKHLQNVIDYLNGKIDLYNGEYQKSIEMPRIPAGCITAAFRLTYFLKEVL